MPNSLIRILLLEDSDLDAELLQIGLTRGGVKHDITRVWTQQDLEQAVLTHTFDLVLADFVLPNFDGMSALAFVHEHLPDVPFIFVSGTLGEDVAIESFKRGATDYVIKQRLDRLPAAIRRARSEVRERIARRQAEKQLREVNASLEATVAERTKERDLVWRLSQDLFFLAGPDGRLSSVNPAWKTLLGVDAMAAQGRFLADLVKTSEQPLVRRVLARFDQVTVVRDIDLHMQAADGTTKIVTWTFVKLPDGQFYGAGRDISERLHLEAQLRQVQKMESIGQLTGGVAHDFNNLLTVILGNLETLQRAQNEDTPPRLRNATANGLRGAERAAELIRSLLAFSRRQALEPQAVDINVLLSGLSDLLGRTLGEHIAIESRAQADAWQTFVDLNQLENAVINLAVNARDAMSGGGKLMLSTENVVVDQAYCEQHSDATPGDYVVLSVIDSGAGMSEDVMARAFDPFFTTKAEGEGTGLGLSQVYGFVRQSGGHVQIDSRLQAGTTIRLYLPRIGSQPRKQVVLRTDTDDAPRARGEETILVVEDEDGVRAHSSETLREMGYRVLEAADGRQALERLAEHDDIQLLFTDIGLPNGMNGKMLAERATAMRPGLPVLFTSAYAAEVLVSDNRLDAGVALITKPFTVIGLAQRVRQALDAAVAANANANATAAGQPAPTQADEGLPAPSPASTMATSSQAVGTCASDTPAAPAAGVSETAAASPESGASARGSSTNRAANEPLRVLLVEDDFMLRTLAVESLMAEGFEVQESGSVGETMDIVHASGLESFDLVIIDIGLPDGRGDTLAKTLRALRPSLPVLILSGNIGQISDPSFYGDPLVALLEKPYRRAVLISAIRSVTE